MSTERVIPDARATLIAREMSFGPFRLVPSRRSLFYYGERVPLGEPAYNVLVALVEKAGEIVDRQTLTARAWRTPYIEESNLRAAIAALRRAFSATGCGRSYIDTIPRRGYRFTETVSFDEESAITREIAKPAVSIHGRDDDFESVLKQLLTHRFVSVVGPGGIGKSVVAQMVAHLAVERGQACGARIIALNDERTAHASENLSAILKVIASRHKERAVESILGPGRVILILDGSERLVGQCAEVVEHFLSASSNVMIVVTTREPLRAYGERIYRLSPLLFPSAAALTALTVESVANYSAVTLFVDRATASQPTFRATDKNIRLIAELCRSLDGLPLAIELAAIALDTFPIETLSQLMSGPSRLSVLGRNTTVDRHRTLHDSVNWSYEFLSGTEKLAFRALSRLSGLFDFEAASEMLASAGLAEQDI
ncbi:conserved hypothetical protein, partial [Ricinus communis]